MKRLEMKNCLQEREQHDERQHTSDYCAPNSAAGTGATGILSEKRPGIGADADGEHQGHEKSAHTFIVLKTLAFWQCLPVFRGLAPHSYQGYDEILLRLKKG